MEVFYNLINSVEDSKDNKCFIFWASNVFFMNDPQEFSFGQKVLMDILKEIETNNHIHEQCLSNIWMDFPRTTEEEKRLKILNNIQNDNESPFVISFTRHEDSLPMWLNYANGGRGVCLAFAEYRSRLINNKNNGEASKSEIEIYDKMDTHDVYYCSSTFKLPNKNIIYDQIVSMYENYYKSRLNTINTNNLFSFQLGVLKALTFLIAPYIKTPMYKGENEVRMVKTIKHDYSNNGKEVQFRLSNKGNLIPYVKVKIPVSQLDYVRIGPLANYSLCRSALEMMMEKFDIHFDIKPSNVEYREY